jgi:integrase
MLTEKQLLKLKCPEKGNEIHFDGEIPGLGARITAAGVISFVLQYRINGRERRYTIGRHPDFSVAGARDEALRLRSEIAKGHDPLGGREAQREAPTIDDMADDYLEFSKAHKRESSIRNDKQMLDNIIKPKLGKIRVAAVTPRDIESLHSALKKTPYRGNRALALLKTMFNWAIRQEWRSDNPAKGIEKFPEEKRERWLQEKELEQLTAALDAHPYQDAANCIRLILLTGCRKSEALSAAWWQFDLGRSTWTKPSAHTKQKKIHYVPLSKAASHLLTEMKEKPKAKVSPQDYLFPGKFKGSHLQDLKSDWKLLTAAAKLENVRVHDLRHTFASHLASSGVPLAVVGKLLGHTQSTTTERYAHLAESPLREATELMGKLVSSKSA